MRRGNLICLIFVIGLGIVSGGCRSGQGWPFLPQGSIKAQQSDALVHDPYPLPDIAPSDKASRPRDFINPLPEPVRNRITPQTQIWTGR
jgi:hypothetical protein